MSENKKSMAGTIIATAVVAGLIGYLAGNKPNEASQEAENAPKDENSSTGVDTGKNSAAKLPMGEGLVAYYPFNGNGDDESLNGKDAEILGATLTTDRHGDFGKAYAFDGKGQNIYIKAPILDANLNSYSVSGWIVVDEENGDGVFFIACDRNGASCDYKYSLTVSKKDNSGSAGFAHYASGFTKKSGHISLADKSKEIGKDIWLHISATYDLKTKKASLYVNGEKTVDKSIENDGGVAIWSSYANPTTFGAWRGCQALTGHNDPRAFMKGKLDDIRFYNRALSAKEVKALYDLEKPKGE